MTPQELPQLAWDDPSMHPGRYQSVPGMLWSALASFWVPQGGPGINFELILEAPGNLQEAISLLDYHIKFLIHFHRFSHQLHDIRQNHKALISSFAAPSYHHYW